jgi:tRNA isopentenyl-2-thiomethyl-A-37 hydroxylase MiaE
MTAPHFTPVFGRKTRQFERMWQAVRYSSGYSAQQMGTAEHQTYTDKHYQQGVADAREDAKRAILVKHLDERAAQTFDQMLEGACK